MKHNITYFIGILAVSTLLLNCSRNNSYDEARQIYDQAIDIHDEVMPRMDRLMQLERSLKAEKEKITDEMMLSRIDSSLDALEDSHNRMMAWMRNITPIPENEPGDNTGQVPGPEEMKDIQQKSLESIREVRQNFNESITEAEKLLESLQK